MSHPAVEASRTKTLRLERALVKIDKLMSDAQDVIARELSNMETKEEFPVVYRLGDNIFDSLEKSRRAIYGGVHTATRVYRKNK
jgi:type IV secretory pathway TraG/TraD family ATPase VirD4